MVRSNPVLTVLQETKAKTIRFVHDKDGLRDKINPLLISPAPRSLSFTAFLPEFEDKMRVFKLNPSKPLSREIMESVKDSIEFDGLSVAFAVPLEAILEASFEPPPMPITQGLKTDKAVISKALTEAKKPHSFLSMRKKLCSLRVDVLKDLAVGANIPLDSLAGLKKRQIADLLWNAVETEEKDTPPNLSSTEIYAILKEHRISPMWKNQTLKESFSMLSRDNIIRIAEAKRVELPSGNPTKEALVDAVWEAKELYPHKLKCFKAKRRVYQSGSRKKNNGIMQYLTLRKKLFDDLPNASIRMLKFKMQPYVFACENISCLGMTDQHLLFCSQPCETKVFVRKKYYPVRFDINKRTINTQ